VVTFAAVEPVRGEVLRYLNRLSDALFVAARAANQIANVPDVAWKQRG
jgi:cob(I)alamin adenosyltransferase